MTQNREWGVRPDITNFTVMFKETLKAKRKVKSDDLVILNDIPAETEADREVLKNTLYRIYEEDAIDVIPKCGCKDNHCILPGEFNVGQKGPKCGVIVRNPYTDELTINRWIRVPDGVGSFINPQVWAVINGALGVRTTAASFSPLQYLTDTRYRVKDKKNLRYIKLVELGIPRGYNYFCDNFFDIMDLVLIPKISKYTKRELQEVKTFLLMFKDCIFTEYLPLPDKTLFTMEKINLNTLGDKNLTHILEGVLNILNVAADTRFTDTDALGSVVANGIESIAAYYHEFGKSSIDPKPGITRKQIIGAREPFTARGIITSQWDIHDYATLMPPWCIALSIFRLHLINKMTKDNIPLRKQYDLLHVYQLRASRTIYKYLKEILDVEFDGLTGFPCEFNRNPTLDRLSGQYFAIADINKDPDIRSIFLSVLCLAGPNADFDGDQMHLKLYLSMDHREAMKVLQPHFGISSMNKPNANNSSLKLPLPAISTISNWLVAKEEEFGERPTWPR